MLIKKKFLMLIALFVITVSGAAQTIKPKKEVGRVKGESLGGSEILVEGTLNDVSAALVKFLKNSGKVKQSDDLIVVNEPTINGATYATPVFALATVKGKSIAVWLGIRAEDWKKENAVKVNKELEALLHDFGVKYYKDKIQTQIDESNRLLQATEKQKQKLLTDNKTLNSKLENNKKEKVALEKSLANNKLEHEALLKRIARNKVQQDSVALAGVQIKKTADAHKERQKKVN